MAVQSIDREPYEIYVVTDIEPHVTICSRENEDCCVVIQPEDLDLLIVDLQTAQRLIKEAAIRDGA